MRFGKRHIIHINGELVTELAIGRVNRGDNRPIVLRLGDSGINLEYNESNGYSAEMEAITSCGNPTCNGLPRFWLLSSFLLCHTIRSTVFLPTFNEFIEDYEFAQLQMSRTTDKVFLRVAFSLRTLRMLAECIYMESKASKIPIRFTVVLIVFAKVIHSLVSVLTK